MDNYLYNILNLYFGVGGSKTLAKTTLVAYLNHSQSNIDVEIAGIFYVIFNAESNLDKLYLVSSIQHETFQSLMKVIEENPSDIHKPYIKHILKTQGKVSAIKTYKDLSDSDLITSKIYVESL